jgi:hypothetical protein
MRRRPQGQAVAGELIPLLERLPDARLGRDPILVALGILSAGPGAAARTRECASVCGETAQATLL